MVRGQKLGPPLNTIGVGITSFSDMYLLRTLYSNTAGGETMIQGTFRGGPFLGDFYLYCGETIDDIEQELKNYPRASVLGRVKRKGIYFRKNKITRSGNDDSDGLLQSSILETMG